jgi:hypothetical protein
VKHYQPGFIAERYQQLWNSIWQPKKKNADVFTPYWPCKLNPKL